MTHANLWAPWREQYLRQLDQADPMSDSVGCFLCDAAACAPDSEEAKKRHVLKRSDDGMLLLNRYPYTNGHLLVACNDHIDDLNGLSPSQRAGLLELTALAQRLLQAAINPQGFNIGINVGRCAGAGVPGHLHVHVVPRWSGDTNFMEVFAQVRVVPQALEASHVHLTQTLKKLASS
jgi:ATP adenylyltransferase